MVLPARITKLSLRPVGSSFYVGTHILSSSPAPGIWECIPVTALAPRVPSLEKAFCTELSLLMGGGYRISSPCLHASCLECNFRLWWGGEAKNHASLTPFQLIFWKQIGFCQLDTLLNDMKERHGTEAIPLLFLLASKAMLRVSVGKGSHWPKCACRNFQLCQGAVETTVAFFLIGWSNSRISQLWDYPLHTLPHLFQWSCKHLVECNYLSAQTTQGGFTFLP